MASLLESGKRIGKYEILTRLALGGMAEVFLAVAAGPGGFRKFVVLKRILPDLRDQHDFVVMLLDEARITAALSHSNIAQVFDLGNEDGELFLVMEFVAGQDMSAVARHAATLGVDVPVGFSCRVVRDACLALHYAHRFVDPSGTPLPIIHRDLSPRNVMVTYAGSVKVIDFGIAKAKGALERTQVGSLKGSISYMSPEQVVGDELDGRSDLFSAGIVLHELLTRKRLFRVPGNDRATLERIANGAIPAPREIDPRISTALSDVTLHALQRDRNARFATGREMAQAIESAVGPLLFDDERVAAFMNDLFKERLERTRTLLGLCVGDTDPARMFEAARAIGQRTASSSTTNMRAVSADESTQLRPAESVSVSVSMIGEPALSWRAPITAPTEPAGPVVALAVDDSIIGRKLVEAHMTMAGFQVVTCSSGEEALGVLAEMRPDVILLDVMMPKMDGFELCQRIRETYDRMTPILFVSAACSLTERMRGLEVGGDDFIRKPYEPADLVARVWAHVRRVASLKSSVEKPAAAQ